MLERVSGWNFRWGWRRTGCYSCDDEREYGEEDREANHGYNQSQSSRSMGVPRSRFMDCTTLMSHCIPLMLKLSQAVPKPR